MPNREDEVRIQKLTGVVIEVFSAKELVKSAKNYELAKYLENMDNQYSTAIVRAARDEADRRISIAESHMGGND